MTNELAFAAPSLNAWLGLAEPAPVFLTSLQALDAKKTTVEQVEDFVALIRGLRAHGIDMANGMPQTYRFVQDCLFFTRARIAMEFLYDQSCFADSRDNFHTLRGEDGLFAFIHENAARANELHWPPACRMILDFAADKGVAQALFDRVAAAALEKNDPHMLDAALDYGASLETVCKHAEKFDMPLQNWTAGRMIAAWNARRLSMPPSGTHTCHNIVRTARNGEFSTHLEQHGMPGIDELMETDLYGNTVVEILGARGELHHLRRAFARRAQTNALFALLEKTPPVYRPQLEHGYAKDLVEAKLARISFTFPTKRKDPQP